ncbi:sensor domain-containing diguanylate cyclase [Vibrio sp. T187]|uniref:sensor domain-containing diguanylate cyclase n=1 Tax=Vibrio TaxID=662 RepID=UPI0010C97C3D|nr:MULTISPECIES: sensor domain-containing diguanylate cyclase [Vibrio]MBW3695911.1 sensor domain-containing diguanylate cyclase [Vibrio sp. T187]
MISESLSAHKKLAVCFVFMFTLSAALIAYYAESAFMDTKQRAKEGMEDNSLLIAEWIRGGFESSDFVLRDVIGHTSSELHSAAHQNTHGNLIYTDFLERKRATLPNVKQVSMLDEHCDLQHSSSELAITFSEYEFCRLFQAREQKDAFISQAYQLSDGSWNISQARQYSHQDAKGVAFVSIDLDFFGNMIRKLKYGKESVIAIYDTNYRLLARQPEIPGLEGKLVSSQSFLGQYSETDAVRFFDAVSTHDGVSRLFLVRKVEGFPFLVVIGKSDEVWQSQWFERTRILASAGFVIIILMWMMLRANLLLQQQSESLKRLHEETAKLARTDMLTQIPNRRAILECGAKTFEQSTRYSKALSVLMIDIDHFKSVNDKYGHDAGDLVLINVAKLLEDALRSCDVVGRLGGEEFVVILPETSLESTVILAERLRERVERLVTEYEGLNITCTISLGAASITDINTSFKELMTFADKGLYQAKDQGRNRLVVWKP